MNAQSQAWGEIVMYADQELLGFALMYTGGFMIPSMYHATQALEKYLKALALSLQKPEDEVSPHGDAVWLKTTDVGYLAQKCGAVYAYYKNEDVLEMLYKYAKCEQAARFPMVSESRTKAFTSEDIPKFMDIIHHLRNDLPITEDDFPLGLALRGYPHKKPDQKTSLAIADLQRIAVIGLKKMYPRITEFVRW